MLFNTKKEKKKKKTRSCFPVLKFVYIYSKTKTPMLSPINPQ